MSTEGRHYQIQSVLGRGGFGTVFRAKLSTDGGFSKIVALKVLNPDMEGVAEVAMRMRDEARLLGMVNHRAVVQVDALVVLDGKWTVVMEYVEGADIKSVLKRGPTPLGPALEVARELGGALDFAYQVPGPDGQPLRLLHRDIKPGNVRITPAGEVKLLDFGIARADFQSREAATKALSFGTPDYMAPERFEFIDGPEGDVFAVGVMVWEMLTGEHFGQTSPAQERHDAKVMAALDKLWQATGGKSEDLVRFIGSMLAFDPAARPTAREVERRATELWRTLGDQPLRDWAESVLPTLTASEQEAVPESLKSKMLTENIRSGAFGYPTEKLGDAPAAQPAAPAPPRPAPAPPRAAPTPPVSSPVAGAPMNDYSSSPQLTQPSGGGGAGIWIALGLLGLLVLAGGVGVGAYFFWKESKGGDEATEEAANTETPTTTSIGGASGTVVSGEATEHSSANTSGSTGPADAGAADAGTKDAGTAGSGTAGSATTGMGDASGASGAGSVAVTAPTPPTKEDEKVDATDEPTAAEADAEDDEKKPTKGTVTVTGGASKVRLVGSKGAFAPGKVPAGSYVIQATFPGGAERAAGKINVTAGGKHTITCSRATEKCTTR